MFAALLLTASLVTTVTQDAPAGAAPDMQSIREQFLAHESSTAPVHLSALSEVVYQRGRFVEDMPLWMRLVKYDVQLEGNLTPAGPDDEGVLRFEVIEARRVHEESAESILAPATVLQGRWAEGYASLVMDGGAPLHGNDRADLAQVIGPMPPGMPTMSDIVDWPEGTVVGDHWIIDMVTFQEQLAARGFNAQLQDLGGEATLLDPGEGADDTDDEGTVLRVLLWADHIQQERRFRTYIGRLEERHEFYIRPGETMPWRHVWTVEQRMVGNESNDPTDRPVTHEFFARQHVDLRVRPIDR